MKTLHTIYTSFAKRVAIIFTLLLTLGVTSVWGANVTFQRITSTSELTSGAKYLIVYESGKLIFNGSSVATGANGETKTVTISNNTITCDEAYAFTITSSSSSWKITGSNGKSIGHTGSSNSLTTGSYTNTISFSNNNVVIGCNSRTLRCNPNNGSPLFRFYTSGQQAIQLYKQTAPSTFSVTYDANGAKGSVPTDANKYASGAKVTAMSHGNLVKEGFSFAGWKRSDNSSIVQENTTFDMPASNLTLTAQWAARALTNYRTSCSTETSVTLNPNGGTFDSDPVGWTIDGKNYVIKHTGTEITLPTNISQEGKIFGGWYKEETKYETIPADLTESITLTAKWSDKSDPGIVWNPTSCNVTIDAGGQLPIFQNPNNLTPITFESSNSEVASVDENGLITLGTTATTATVTITATFDGNATYAAKNVTCTLTVNPSNCRWVEVTDNTTLEDGDEVVVMMAHGTDLYALPYDKEKAGNSNPVATSITLDDFEGRIVDELIWFITKDHESNNFTLSPKTATDKYLTCNKSSNAVRINTGENRNFTIENDFLKNTTFNTYLAISLEATQKDWRHYESTNTTISSKAQTLKFYKRECLDASKVWVEGNLTNVTCDTQLPQQLAKNGSITLTFAAADGYVLPNNVTVTNATKTWNKEDRTLTISNPTSNVVITISALQTYTINYVGGAGDGITGSHDSQTKIHGTGITLADKCFTRPGYTQTGWATSDGGAKAYDLLGMYTANENVTLYPVWTKHCSVSFETGTDNPKVETLTEAEAGAGITLPAGPTPTCTDWTFAGWWTEAVTETTTSPGELLTADSNYKPANDCTLYAVYSITESNGGGGSSEITLLPTSFPDKGSNAYDSGAERVATVNGIEFGGHHITGNQSGNPEGASQAQYLQCRANDATIYNKTELPGKITQIVVNQYDAKAFSLYCGSTQLMASDNVDRTQTPSGTKITDVSAATTMTWDVDGNYTFFALKKGSNAGYVKSIIITYSGGGSTTTYNSNPVCVASYSITYNFAGGTGSHCSNTSVPQGDPYTICDEAPTREGYTFQGWSDGTSTYAAGATITPTGDVTLTAVWEANTYTVTWNNNGDTDEVIYNHGDALVVPNAPASCDGVKEFVGWTEQSGYYHATTAPTDLFKTTTATVTADKTYYAVFATQGEGSANFVLGESGTFKMYANVEGTNYYAQGGVSSNKITSTTEAANASDYTLTYADGVYTIKQGTSNVGNKANDADLNTNETTWTISEGTNGSWRVTSNVSTSRALSYSTSASAFKAYSISNITGSPTIYYDIEFGGTSSGYSDYTTKCQQIESIEVQNPQTEFYLTDDFTIGEGKVMATLSDGITKVDVTSLATFSGYNMNVVGTYTVTVTYMGATATYEINVKPLDNAWVLTWNVSGKTNTGLGPRSVTKGTAIGTLPTPIVPDACEGKTFMGWTTSNIVNSDGTGITYITPTTVPTDNTTYYAVFATVNNFCTQKPIDQITSGSKVVIVAVASLTADGGSGKAISSRATDDTYNLQGDDVAIYDQTINTPHNTCIWTINKEGEKYVFTQDGKYLNAIKVDTHYNLKYNVTKDTWTLTSVAGKDNTYHMQSTNTKYFAEFYTGKFTLYKEANDQGKFDMQFFVTANANGDADITDYTTGCTEYTITYYGFRGGYSTSTSSDGTIVLPVNSMHTVPNCGDVVKDHTNLGREFLDVWMTQPHGGHTFKPGDTFILTQDTTLYAQWKMETTSDVTTLPTDIEDLAGTDVYVYGGKTLNIQPGTTTINSLTLKGGLQADGSYKMPIVWVPEGATLVRNSNKIYLDLVVNAKNYYPFAVPFATKNDQYIDYLDPVLNKASTYGTHFVIKTYDGALRATNGEDRANNWVKVLRHATDKPSSLQPGVGYIIQALTYPDKDTATIRIPMTVPNTWFENGEQAVVGSTARNTIAVTAHAGDAATEHKRHAGWNFVASPYLTNFAGGNVENNGGLEYINGELTVNGGWQYGGDEVPYVTIPAYDFSYYTQHKLSDVKLSPEWSFFVQIGTSGTMDFSTAGRQETPASIAARHDAAQSFKMDVDITLSDKNHSDQMGLIICDHFSSAYEVGYDLEKMFGSAYNLTVYTLMEDNTPLAYHALAIHSNMQVIPVGYRVPEQGDYTFALNQSTSSIDLLNEQYEQLILVDYETGALTNLLNSTYTFTSPRTQSDSRFAIYAVIRQDTPTDLPNIDDGDNSTRKILHNGHLYILRDGKVYNGNGQIVK